ncbi:CaiB/BaiF CoA transferase family protein [Oceanibium sediminis]|uniref:CaiB/BaiF CoA transferase family protein n=1 Tax=Oceanibium sediminis TaxID=2026339 RepID=UPI000DD35FD4|nr:CaiB/BaiF CoA-transferase family protein [Oceanibium sediminis]
MPDSMPLAGLRVLDFGHTVMGPTAGLVLADLGAEVIRVEPAGAGDPTRRLKGFGTGYFPFYNRNKQSVALDLKDPRGLALARQLVGTADVLIENFGPGTMARLGLDHETLSAAHPGLVYLSLKGFLPGPYEDRVALDEVVQMMSGLAYMTGPPGQPLRAGASVIDVLGGVFGVIGVLAALRERDATGRGQLVKSALFESAMFLMGQHLATAAISGAPVPPMPARVSAWAIYDQFDTKDGARVFLGITSDRHWARFCEVFARPDLAADPALSTNNARISARPRLLPEVAALLSALPLAEVSAKAIAAALPFAHIARPEDLFDDPHLLAGGRLLDTVLPAGLHALLPALPLEMAGRKTALHTSPPAAGADTALHMRDLGYSEQDIAALAEAGVVMLAERP